MAFKKLITTVCLLLLPFTSALAGPLEFADGWVRLVPPVSQNTAGYIKLTNTSDKAITIVSAKSNVAKKTEIHDMKMEKGAMSMFQIPELVINAGESVELRPGGKHIMMMGLNEPLKNGQMVDVTLTMADGVSVSVELPVKRGGMGQKQRNVHNNKKEMNH